MTLKPLPTRAFYFLRHGETDFNRERRFQGRIDASLNAHGQAQAEAAGRALARLGIDRIISSPARRVLQTTARFAESNDVPIQIDDDLMEFFVGSFEGRRIAAIKEQYGLGAQDSLLSILPDDAEKWHEFAPRVCAAVRRWTEHYNEERLLFAAHGLVFRALTETLTDRASVSNNAEPHYFEPNGGDWLISKITHDG